MSRRAIVVTSLLFAALVAVVGAVGWHGFHPLRPAHGRAFHSDDAIIFRMLNDAPLTPYHLYFFGQDRFGGLPFILGRLAAACARARWSIDGWYAVHLSAVLLALPALLALGGRWGLWLAAVAGAALVADFSIAQNLLSVNAPYGWQLTGLVWAWWLTRRALSSPDPSRERSRIVARSLTLAAAYFIPVWMSGASIPMLAVAVWIESRRAQEKGAPFYPAGAAAVIGLVGATVVEGGVRAVYHAYGARFPGAIHATPTRLDLGHLYENTRAVAAVIGGLPSAPLAWVALVAGVLLLAVDRFRAVDRELAAVCMVASAMAWANAALFASLSWSRLNQYNDRYLSPSAVLWGVSAAALLGLLVTAALRRRPRWRSACNVVAALALIAWIAVTPPAPLVPPRTAEDLAVAQTLHTRWAGAVVRGGYWDTYVLGAFAPDLVPLPFSGSRARDPFTRAHADAAQVLATHRESDAWGSCEAPRSEVVDSGVRYVLSRGQILQTEHYCFSLYER